MAATTPPDTDELVQRSLGGDPWARHLLLDRHRGRLRRMVALRMDRRLAARVDPSDVVQETLAEAARRLDAYLRDRPLPYYPWLRQIAWDHLIAAHRRHLGARGRSVRREEGRAMPLPDESVAELARRLVADGISPSEQVVRDELRQRVRVTLDRLPGRDREVLVMRHLEQMDNDELAAALGLGAGAVRARYVRALRRLREMMDAERPEDPR